MTANPTAPAEMPGVYRIADEFERELFAWRNLPSRDGVALRACAYALAQKAETLFAPILAEKEREKREVIAAADAQFDEHAESCRRADAAEARALAAEAAVLAVSPYIDSIVCYASTIDTHDGNRVAKLVNEAAAAIMARDSAGPIANDNRKEVAA